MNWEKTAKRDEESIQKEGADEKAHYHNFN